MQRVIFDIAALIARVVIGVIFVAHGLQKWTLGLGQVSAGFEQMGVPLPQAAAAFSTVVEVVCGVLLILGLAVRVAAVLLLIDMIGALVFVHAPHGVFIQDNGWELAAALGTAALLFLALGGGRIGIDGIINAVFKRRSRRAAAGQDDTPTRPLERPRETQDTRDPRDPRDQGRASGLDDRDMADVDQLLKDEPARHRRR